MFRKRQGQRYYKNSGRKERLEKKLNNFVNNESYCANDFGFNVT